MVVHSVTASRGVAPVTKRLDILAQLPVAILIAAVAAVVPYVHQAPVPAIFTLKETGPKGNSEHEVFCVKITA
jgi:hypothetical protein